MLWSLSLMLFLCHFLVSLSVSLSISLSIVLSISSQMRERVSFPSQKRWCGISLRMKTREENADQVYSYNEISNAMINWRTESIRHYRKSAPLVKATDKTQTQGWELVEDRPQSNSGNDTTFFFLNSIENYGRTDWPTKETQDREQKEIKWHTNSCLQSVDQRFTDQNLCTELSLQKRKSHVFPFSPPKYNINTFVRKRKQSRNAKN